jgi:hypothetical protein
VTPNIRRNHRSCADRRVIPDCQELLHIEMTRVFIGSQVLGGLTV